MLFVSDTHSLVWFLTEDRRLGGLARRIFEQADTGANTIVVPSIVLSELLHIATKKDLKIDFEGMLDKIESSSNYACSELGIPVLRQCAALPRLRDIHDKIIVATALLAKTKLITKDKRIKRSGYVQTVW